MARNNQIFLLTKKTLHQAYFEEATLIINKSLITIF